MQKKVQTIKAKSDHNIVWSDAAKTQKVQLSPSLLRLDNVSLSSAERTVRGVASDGLSKNETNYNKLGARPKTNSRKNLSRNTLVESPAVEIKSPTKKVANIGCRSTQLRIP